MKFEIYSTWIASSLFFCGLLTPITTNAQIIPDATLPVNSLVIPSGNTSIIEGGTSSGGNLFHSFQEFSVPTGGTAFFNNNVDIQNIFSRVTGKSISNIDGLIRANGVTNLFLLNPNGIIFGSNAQLNIGGSFLATTASSFKFADGTEFSATNSQQAPLLTVNVPVGLQFSNAPGDIINKSIYQVLLPSPFDPTQTPVPTPVGLTVVPGQTIALVGGKVTLDGGYLTASSGQIELGSVAGNSLVNLTTAPSASGFSLGYEGVANFDDIQLTNLASVNGSGISGGQIRVQGRNVTLTGGAKITSNTLGSISGRNITINASDSFQLLGTTSITGLYEPLERFFGILVNLRSGISTNTFGAGNAGDIFINTRELIIRDGAQITAGSFFLATGNAGDITIDASESMEVKGVQPVFGSSTITNNSSLSSQFLLEINGASAVGTSTGTTGTAGNIKINTNRLIIQDGGIITANPFAAGAGGTLTVNAGDSVIVSGTSPSGVVRSLIVTTAVGSGDAKDLTINTGRLIVENGGLITTQTTSSGNGGNLIVNAYDSIELSGLSKFYQSELLADSMGAGDAGNLTIATRELIVRNEAQVSVRGTSTGGAGDLNITAGNVRLDSGTLTGATAAGERGNITVQTESLQLRRGSTITTNATGKATGGNITLTADTIAALQNSDITANAEQSFGGRVAINTNGIFGTQFREQQTPASDITASSQLGVAFGGVVEINTPDVDPRAGLVELPANYVDASDLIASSCPADRGNSFIVTGPGGLPTDPTQALSSRAISWDVRSLGEQGSRGAGENINSALSTQPSLTEVTGWRRNQKGEVELLANASVISAGNPWHRVASCGDR